MARTRRRTGKTQKTPEPTGATADDDAQLQAGAEAAEEGEKAQEERCPACRDGDGEQPPDAADKEKWVRCDACKTWFHWRCAGEGDLDAVDKWCAASYSLCARTASGAALCSAYGLVLTARNGRGRRFCRPCLDADPARVITMKPPARKSARKKAQRDYAGLNSGQDTDPNRWLRMMEGKEIKKDPFRRMRGADVGVEWLQNDEGAMTEPVLVEAEEGLGMKMPPASFTVGDVAEALGDDFPVEVIGTFLFPARSSACAACRGVHAQAVRRGDAVQRALDPGQVERVLGHRTRETRQDPERHLARDLRHRAGGSRAPSAARARARLGGEVLAEHQEGKGPHLSQGPAVLSHGRWWRVDGAYPVSRP